jgi:hypothetical protein
MIAFEVSLNGKKMCTAVVGKVGVLSTILSWRGPQPYEKGGAPVGEDIRLDVGGLESDSGDHVGWADQNLKRGDVVAIKVLDVRSVDKPTERKRPDPAGDLRSKKRYVREMAKQLGRKIQT